jgi:hypothetical protein
MELLMGIGIYPFNIDFFAGPKANEILDPLCLLSY